VIDATGDLDVAATAGAAFAHGSYILTTVFRLGGVAQLGLGSLYILGRAAGWGQLGLLDMADVMFGYGNTFLVTAGLMNMLLIMDAFDIAVGRKE